MAPSQPRRPGPVTRSMTKGKHYCYHSDSLNCLPDDILCQILSKITDPKTLLISSLISKRIAYILSHFHSLSLQFPTPPTMKHYGDQLLWVTSLLGIFNRVRSLRIEFPCSCFYSDGKEVFKWKAKTGIRCGVLSLLSSSESVSKIDFKKVKVEEEDEEEGGRGGGEEEEAEEEEDLIARSSDMMGPLIYARRMYDLMQLLVSLHPNLDSVELIDSKKHGKLSLHGEALIKLRKTMLDSTTDATTTTITEPKWLDFYGDSGHDRTWYVPKLLLPLTGYVMKKVMLRVFRTDGVADGNGVGGVGEEVEDNGDVLDGGFVDDEDGIFSEAMTQLLCKHPFRTRYFYV